MLIPNLNLFAAAPNRQDPVLAQQASYAELMTLKQALIEELTATYSLRYARIKWKFFFATLLFSAIFVAVSEITGNAKQNEISAQISESVFAFCNNIIAKFKDCDSLSLNEPCKFMFYNVTCQELCDKLNDIVDNELEQSFVNVSMFILNMCLLLINAFFSDWTSSYHENMNTKPNLLGAYTPCQDVLCAKLRETQPGATQYTVKALQLNKLESLVDACIQDTAEYKSKCCLMRVSRYF